MELAGEKCCGAKSQGAAPFYRTREKAKGKGGYHRRGGD
jgi:hypothetical protein